MGAPSANALGNRRTGIGFDQTVIICPPVSPATDVFLKLYNADGTEVGRGTGADVLGHPHNALAWLANHLAEEGKGLHEGQIVLTGSLANIKVTFPDDLVLAAAILASQATQKGST